VNNRSAPVAPTLISRGQERAVALSSGEPDIRGQVEASRGPLKKLQLLIPGLRGYRRLEDIRVSDEMLRNQVADKLDSIRKNLEALRKKMVASNDFTNLGAVGSLISKVQQLSGQVRHAEQGYSGLVAPIAITEDKLNRLYDYDYSFVSTVFQLESSTSPSNLVYDPASPNSVSASLAQIAQALSDISEKWSVRIETIEEVLVK
jgi:hypothetical protein